MSHKTKESMTRNTEEFLVEAAIPFEKDASLASLSTVRAGGTCRFLVTPNSVEKLQQLLVFFRESGIPFRVVGRLSNIIFRDGIIETMIVSTTGLKGHGFTADGLYRAECGVALPSLARQLSADGFCGFSGLAGIPASVGGAVYMNASCYGNAISDCLVRIRCSNEAGEIVEIGKEDAAFSWRHSAFHGPLNGTVILEAYFELRKGDMAQIADHLEASAADRRSFQEQHYPNLGSTFATRDIYGSIASRFPLYRIGFWLIRVGVRLYRGDRDRLWARLMNRYTQRYFRIMETDRVGFSERTFNCIVNKGNATASELISFIREVEKRINHCVPVELELFEEIA